MTFEEFCAQVAAMIVQEDRPHVTASTQATHRAAAIIHNYEHVSAVELFGADAIKQADYSAGMVADARLLAGVIAYVLDDPSEWDDGTGMDPLPLTLPARMATWFVLAIRDPHLALDGMQILIHGEKLDDEV